MLTQSVMVPSFSSSPLPLLHIHSFSNFMLTLCPAPDTLVGPRHHSSDCATIDLSPNPFFPLYVHRHLQISGLYLHHNNFQNFFLLASSDLPSQFPPILLTLSIPSILHYWILNSVYDDGLGVQCLGHWLRAWQIYILFYRFIHIYCILAVSPNFPPNTPKYPIYHIIYLIRNLQKVYRAHLKV